MDNLKRLTRISLAWCKEQRKLETRCSQHSQWKSLHNMMMMMMMIPWFTPTLPWLRFVVKLVVYCPLIASSCSSCGCSRSIHHHSLLFSPLVSKVLCLDFWGWWCNLCWHILLCISHVVCRLPKWSPHLLCSCRSLSFYTDHQYILCISFHSFISFILLSLFFF